MRQRDLAATYGSRNHLLAHGDALHGADARAFLGAVAVASRPGNPAPQKGGAWCVRQSVRTADPADRELS